MDDSLLVQVSTGQVDVESAVQHAIHFHALDEDGIAVLDHQLIELSNQPEVDGNTLIRLSRFNHQLAQQIARKELVAQTAFTLCQMLMGNPAFIEERVQLIEFSVPILEQLQRSPQVMSMVFYHATITYHDLSRFDRYSYAKVIEYGTKALQQIPSVKGFPADLLQQLHLLVGSSYCDLPETSQGDLKRSMDHLETAVDMARRMKSDDLVGLTMNNLGHTMHVLGKLARDCEMLERAVHMLEEALQLRESEKGRQLIQKNIAGVQESLMELESGGSQAAQTHVQNDCSDAASKVQMAESLLKWLKRGEHPDETEKQQALRSAMSCYCDAKQLADEIEEPKVHAGADLGIGIALNMGDSTSEAAVGVCFLKAAERRWSALNVPTRLASAQLNLGLAFSTILDSRGEATYMPLAAEYLERAWRTLEKIGAKDMAHYSLVSLAACCKVMGEAGDIAAMARSEELFRLAGIDPNLG